MGVPPKWMINFRENPVKMDDLEVPPFVEYPCIYIYTYTYKWDINGL
jgi:hypothetical protein